MLVRQSPWTLVQLCGRYVMRSPMNQPRLHWWRGIVWAGVLFGMLGLAIPGQSADFSCAAGDVDCLIDAITQANSNGESNTITMEAGTYLLTEVNNSSQGNNGLPVITGNMTIQGAGMERTIISTGPDIRFRLLHVGSTGTLTVEGLTLRGGNGLTGGGLLNQGGTVAIGQVLFDDNFGDAGGGLNNDGGLVTIDNAKFVANASFHGGGGLRNASGIVLISQTSFARNVSDGGGAISNAGTMFISNCAIVENLTGVIPGGGISNSGTLIAINTTIARNTNVGGVFGGAGLHSSGGVVTLTNSTVVHNVARSSGAGLQGGTFVLLNSIVALNGDHECLGTVTSLGNNLIGDPNGCTITLQSTDLTGDPNLANFRDNGTPGNGHFPLRGNSPAINAGNDALCPQTDQLGQQRTGQCDIGAINFPGRRSHGPVK
jgi:hypothetical protein